MQESIWANQAVDRIKNSTTYLVVELCHEQSYFPSFYTLFAKKMQESIWANQAGDRIKNSTAYLVVELCHEQSYFPSFDSLFAKKCRKVFGQTKLEMESTT